MAGEKEPLPKNYSLIVDQKRWNEAQESCKREKLVVAMEITNPFDDACNRVRPLFVDLAKEFGSIPFFRVVTGPGRELEVEKLCCDVGQLHQPPTIILLYYDAEEHIKRKSYQGERAIREAVQDGQLKRKVEEFINERSLSQDELVRGKMAKHDTTEIVHPGIPESAETGIDSNETIPKMENPQHHHEDTTGGSIDEPDNVDEPDLTATTTAVSEFTAVPEPTPVPEPIPLPEPSTAPEPTTEAKLDASHIINIKEIKCGKRIGQGGFGVVYEAKWNGKQVAAKVCLGNLIEHFPREVEILASLPTHPNVIMFFGIALSHDKISTLIITELATNGSLFSYLHEKKHVPSADQRLAWAVQIATGMAHLHSHNVIHRDLKSGNILLSLGMVAKVCDFGTARPLAKTTKQTNMTGTYRWMSPEVMEDAEANINNKCDVFSYGMVLYEIYAREIPYAGMPDAVVGGVVLSGKRPPVPDTVPPFLRVVLQRCWEHDPKKRPAFKDIVLAIPTASFDDGN